MEREKVGVERSERGRISSSSPFCTYVRAREKKRKRCERDGNRFHHMRDVGEEVEKGRMKEERKLGRRGKWKKKRKRGRKHSSLSHEEQRHGRAYVQ